MPEPSEARFSPFVAGLARPLDRLRWHLLRASGALGRFFVRRREARVAVGGVLLMAMALVLTVVAPFWLLALGPVVWGIPHVLADFRYLVVRPGLHRRLGLACGVGIPLAVAGAGWHSVPMGLAAAGMAALLARGAPWRKGAALMVVAVLFCASLAAGDFAMLVFAHAHNFVALALWWAWRPMGRGLRLVVPLAFVVMAGALWLGSVGPTGEAVEWAPCGMGGSYHLSQLAPGLADPWALRLVLLFAFAQAVHYGIWLRLIPEDDRPQPSPRTWAASFRALERDLGPWLLWGTLVAMSGLARWALFDLVEARAGYLRMALFHGYLELAAAALLFVEGRRGFEATRGELT